MKIELECLSCQKNTYFDFNNDDQKGCINQRCLNVNWDFSYVFIDILEKKVYEKFNFCGCGNPEETVLFLKKFLDLKIEFLTENKLSIDEYLVLRKELFLNNIEELFWLVDYYFDEKKITQHCGSVFGSWVEDIEWKKILDLYVKYKHVNND